MSSAKASSKSEPTLANATAKTRSVIEGFQARLKADSPNRSHTHVNSVSASRPQITLEEHETEEDLERQLQAYFATISVEPGTGSVPHHISREQVLDELRNRVVDGVVMRILAEWARREQEMPGSAGLGAEIMERLVQRVLEQFQKFAIAS